MENRPESTPEREPAAAPVAGVARIFIFLPQKRKYILSRMSAPPRSRFISESAWPAESVMMTALTAQKHRDGISSFFQEMYRRYWMTVTVVVARDSMPDSVTLMP